MNYGMIEIDIFIDYIEGQGFIKEKAMVNEKLVEKYEKLNNLLFMWNEYTVLKSEEILSLQLEGFIIVHKINPFDIYPWLRNLLTEESQQILAEKLAYRARLDSCTPLSEAPPNYDWDPRTFTL